MQGNEGTSQAAEVIGGTSQAAEEDVGPSRTVEKIGVTSKTVAEIPGPSRIVEKIGGTISTIEEIEGTSRTDEDIIETSQDPIQLQETDVTFLGPKQSVHTVSTLQATSFIFIFKYIFFCKHSVTVVYIL